MRAKKRSVLSGVSTTASCWASSVRSIRTAMACAWQGLGMRRSLGKQRAALVPSRGPDEWCLASDSKQSLEATGAQLHHAHFLEAAQLKCAQPGAGSLEGTAWPPAAGREHRQVAI